MPLCERRPRSPRLLVLLPGDSARISHKHAPTQSSYLVFPPSPTSLRAIPRTPLTPPPRLHLRSIRSDLPSSPVSPQYLATVPDIPYPWIWRCHNCGSMYRLGVTRRCLEDGHFFCSAPPEQAAENPTCASEANSTLDTGERPTRKVKQRREKSQRSRRRASGCSAEFDYAGWAQYNQWRRTIKVYKIAKAARLTRRSQRRCVASEEHHKEMEWQSENDCWVDCEFPSECNNNRLQEEIERRKLQELFVEPEFNAGVGNDKEDEGREEESWNYTGQVMRIEEWEAELQRQEVAEHEKGEEELREMEKFAVAIHGVDPASLSPSFHSSSVPSSILEMDIVGMERRGLEGEAQMVDVSLGPLYSSTSPLSSYSTPLDEATEDLYGGQEFAKRKRKKSIQKIAQLTGLMLGVEPVVGGYEDNVSSPLKEEFDFSDQSLREAREVEMEIEELEQSGNMTRRRVG